MNILDVLMVEPGAFYVMDRGYLDFKRLYRVHTDGTFFVTRAKSNMNAHRLYSAPVDRPTGLVFDQTIALNKFYAARDYPGYLRRIRFKDPETSKTLAFLTNNTQLPAETICALYKSRWQVELLFKWIKATSTHHPVLGDDRERRQSPGLVCDEHLLVGRYREKGASLGCLPLQFITDFIGGRF